MDLIIGFIVERLIKRAVRILGEEQRGRCEEEWLAHIHDTPGKVGKLIATIGFLRTARTIPGPSGARGEKSRWRAVAQWLEDKVLSTLCLFLCAPLMAITALVIKLDTRGPVLSVQERLGVNNDIIEVLKFRTMHVDRGDQSGTQRTVPNDPRVTRVGRVLRASSIDELPLLFNVLHGDISLCEVSSYSAERISLYEDGKQWDRIIDKRAFASFYIGLLNILVGLVVGMAVGRYLL
jgi:hypothetical protein